MFCNKCGKEIGDDSKFCNNCGYKFEIPKNIDEKKVEEEYVWTCDYCGKEFDSELKSDKHEEKCDKNPKNIKDSSSIYCPKCGIGNSNKARFCKDCGEELTPKITEKEGEIIEEGKKNDKTGLTGWVALIGLGLIIGFFRNGYGLFPYFSLMSTSYEIPGFTTLLQFEFICSIAFLFFIGYVLYLYFKKSIKFPKYYIIFLVYPIIFSLIDIIWLGSLSFTTQEIKKAIDDSITEASSELLQGLISSVVWITYIIKSKQVKRTCINDGN